MKFDLSQEQVEKGSAFGLRRGGIIRQMNFSNIDAYNSELPGAILQRQTSSASSLPINCGDSSEPHEWPDSNTRWSLSSANSRARNLATS
jgi:hypothetical protein